MSRDVPLHPQVPCQHFPFHAYGSLSLYLESRNSKKFILRKPFVEGSFHASLCAKGFPLFKMHYLFN